ncbi:APH(3'') family aminoglycoside O-phosphotransferase [Bradyrhizobium sp. LHD-71]|uniref:APH(3'') family aminoglycoside O-phosphotransferase n=1 Tax=Bradyrhizobium sp. LHD-71 TaxID=3072141 RepID=UPI00280DB505|nr:APH(3'') family aminoglycoside O-phosphotransferase [Bradyrhizobium sp. LHD-71]MDQ8728993.1 APH(3'') family aminoglycoside O-phosphotransferase [Bradyrhizobium sp. LHD-71]
MGEHDWADALLGRWGCSWIPVSTGESSDLVYRRDDRLAYAKLAPSTRSIDLAGERDRLTWLDVQAIACPKVIDWQEAEEGACLVMSAIPGIAAVELSAPELLKAWPSMARQLGALHELAVDQCPFNRGLSLMFERAVSVVTRNEVNPDFLPDEDKDTPGSELLARIASEVPARRDQEDADRVVCHGDPCMPNFVVDPQTLQCTGVIDLGRLGTADRYADLALIIANAAETWTTREQSEQAGAILFNTLGIEAPDRERLTFYLRLDPLTWG